MKPQHTCIIIDDEPKAAELLQDSITSLFKNIRVKGVYHRWDTALTALRDGGVDILLLDISMPEKNGIDLLRLVPELDAEIIFVTAHSEYALHSFKFFPSGYLLKPVNEVELSVTLNKSIERIQAKKKATVAPIVPQEKKIGIPGGKGIDYVLVDPIVYLVSENSYTRVVLLNEEILSSYSISRFKSILEGEKFLQVHRSYMVHLKHMKRYSASGALLMENGHEVPVSKAYKDEVLSQFSRVTRDGDDVAQHS
jgi:two-component system, LytTR family, response regulator